MEIVDESLRINGPSLMLIPLRVQPENKNDPKQDTLTANVS